jgi:hypothetical protein
MVIGISAPVEGIFVNQPHRKQCFDKMLQVSARLTGQTVQYGQYFVSLRPLCIEKGKNSEQLQLLSI